MTQPAGKRRSLLRRLGLFLLSSLLGLGALEVALRTLPLKRASTLSNEVYTAYGSFPGGIYFTEPETRINFMVPGFATENFWNGYSWRHRADELGFRNPSGLQDRSLLLLGDSLIYGHGVEEEHTVAHLLRTREGRPAYNMARQGDCLYQQYVLLRLYRDELAPRTVVLFVFFNDFADLLFYRTREEIEQMPELRLDGQALRQRVADLGRNPRYPLRRQLYRSRSLRLLRGVARSFSEGDWMARAEAAPAREDDLAAAVLRPERFALASRYYRRVLEECQRLAAEKEIDLRVVLLDVGAGSEGRRAYERLRLFLQETSGEAGFSFTTTAGVFAGCGDCFLPHDGHFSPRGHDRLARFLDTELPREIRTR